LTESDGGIAAVAACALVFFAVSMPETAPAEGAGAGDAGAPKPADLTARA
jgi:hypothetical protein